MAHYAFISNDDNVVTEVIVGRNENETVDNITDWESYYATKREGVYCRRTSYNSNIRFNFAGIGFTYDEDRDAFIPPQPFPSWVLDEDTCLWEAPVAMPDDGEAYTWDEESESWVATPEPEVE